MKKNPKIYKVNFEKVLLKKKLKSYPWFSEKAYKYIHNRFRWFMLRCHYYEYKHKQFFITNVIYDNFYSNFLFIEYSIDGKKYVYRCDLRFLDL